MLSPSPQSSPRQLTERGDSSVMEFTLSGMRFFAPLRMTGDEGFPQSDKKFYSH